MHIIPRGVILTFLTAIFLALVACDRSADDKVGPTNDGGAAGPAPAGEVNVYSARHYDSDDALFARFTNETGITVNLIEANADELIARIEREGDLSPADVLIVVDAARLHRAEEKNLFAPFESEVVAARIPANRRHPEGLWVGLTERARIVVAHRERVSEGAIARYEDLADPEWQGRLLVRSSSHVYNQSLVASMIGSLGSEATEEWCRGVVANLARTPQGGDRDQIRAVAAGEGDVAIVNHYYLAQMLDGEDPSDRAAAEAVRVIFPNQGDRGAHVNICGAGVLRGAPNREHAIRFIEFLASAEAQSAFAAGNYEYPVTADAEPVDVVRTFGPFRADEVVVSDLGVHNAEAVQAMDRAGWR